MKCSNRCANAKLRGQRVPDCRRSGSKGTFTLLRFNEKESEVCDEKKIVRGARWSLSDKKFSKVKMVD